MKVAFISEYDLNNPNLRSGVPYYITQAMLENKLAVTELMVQDGRRFTARIISRLAQFYFSITQHKRYDASVSVATSKAYARQINGLILAEVDFIFSISPKLVAFLETSKPILLWIDNSFLSFSLYPGVQNLSSFTYREALQVEKRAFQNCTHLFVASAWLKEQLCKQYSFLHSKISILPRGANISQRPKKSVIEQQVIHKMKQPLQLLHINSGWWQRKGGDFTISIWEKLREKIKVELTIIGSVPVDKKVYLEDKGVILWGNIDKNSASGFLFFSKIMSSAHFLLVPSIAEGFGIVYAEAASFGVPSIAFGVMGVTEAIQQNITGIHLTIDAGVEEFADAILSVWQNKLSYKTLSTSSYEYAKDNFEWQTNVRTLVEKVKSVQ